MSSPVDVSCVETKVVDRVAIVIVDNPPVNALSRQVRQGLVDAIGDLSREPEVDAIVVAGSNGSFIAGADIREFDGPALEPQLPAVIEAIEASKKPVVAAIGKAALGGGFEIALACHDRVAERSCLIGFPEVKLGIIPGAGGIERAMRLAAADVVLELAAGGKPIGAGSAFAAGLVDELADDDVLPRAIARARMLTGHPLLKTSARELRSFDDSAFRQASERWTTRARGQQSVSAAVSAANVAATNSFEQATALNRRLFLELRASDQAAALRHLFFAEREALNVPGIDARSGQAVRQVAVVGAGTMGRGIASACLLAGYPVRLIDTSRTSLDTASAAIAETLRRSAMSGRSAEGAFDRLALSVDLDALSDCDLVIEAVFEEFAVKTEVLRDIGRHVGEETSIATNTSYLDIDLLAEASGNAQRIIGLHFFAPAEVMRLVEIVRGRQSGAEVLATGIRFARSLGKVPVVSGVCEGFIVNRILAAYRRETEYILEDGALPYQVDEALQDFGMAMGPFAVSDLSGLDIAWARRKRLAATRSPAERYVVVADRLCEMGRLGRKTGAGWYRYREGRRERDDVVEQLVSDASAEKGIVRRTISAAEIVERAFGAMVLEAEGILAEGVALRAGDIDLAVVNGLGFPAWRGGPLYARRLGMRGGRQKIEPNS